MVWWYKRQIQADKCDDLQQHNCNLSIWLFGRWLFTSREHSSISVLVWLKGVTGGPLKKGTLGHLLADGAACWLLAVRRTYCPQRGRVSRVPSITLSSREVRRRLMTQPRSAANLCILMCSDWMDEDGCDTTRDAANGRYSATARQSSSEWWLRCSAGMVRGKILLSYISRLLSFPQKPSALGWKRRSGSELLGDDHLTKLQ